MNSLSPIYSPRTSLKITRAQESKLIEKVCFSMDKALLSILQREISDRQLGEEEFVIIMSKALVNFEAELTNREIKMSRALLEMFSEITVGREECVRWATLSDYLINKAREAKKESPKQEECSYSKAMVQPKVRCQNKIMKCISIPSLQISLFCEQNSNIIQILDPRTGILSAKPIVLQPHKLTVQSSTVRREKGKTIITNKEFVVETSVTVMDFIFVEQIRYNILLVSLSDGVVCALSYGNGSFTPAYHLENEELLEFKFQRTPYCLEWDSLNQTLYCGCQNDTIYKWSFKTSIQSTLSSSSEQENIVMCMTNISKLQVLASASMDGRLVFWDTVTSTKKSAYKEHSRGILAITYSEEYMLLFSAGFDHQICVWNPYVQGIVHKISTHLETIISLQMTPQQRLLSMDEKGNIVVFNIKTFDVVNSLQVESTDNRANSAPTCVCVISNPHRIAVCGYTIFLLHFDSSTLKDYADNSVPLVLSYLQKDQQLLTISSQRLKKWNMLSGETQMIFNNNKQEIISASIDSQRSLVYIATRSKVSVHNAKNMFKIRELPKQELDIDCILHFRVGKTDNLVAVVEGFYNGYIYKEMMDDRYERIKQFNVSKDVLICTLLYNHFDNNLAIGTNVGVVGFFDIESGKSVASTTSLDPYTEILGIHLVSLATVNVIVEVTKVGTISVIRLPPKLERLYSCRVKDCEKPAENQKIQCSAFDAKTKKLFVGDEKGFVVCYGLQIVFDQIDLCEASKSETKISTNAQRLWAYKVHSDSVSCLLFLASEGWLVSGGFDRKVKIRTHKGEALEELRQSANLVMKPIAYLREKGKQLEIYADINGKKRVNTKAPIELNLEEQEYNPRVIYDKIELEELSSTCSNPTWKIQVDYSKYCQERRNKYKKFVEKVKRTRLNQMRNQMLPKLRENLQRSINDSLSNIVNSEEAKHNTTIESSTRIYHKMVKTESLPKLDHPHHHARQFSRDNVILLSKPKLRMSESTLIEKPKLHSLSKEVVDAYRKLNLMLGEGNGIDAKMVRPHFRRKE